jgi:AraC family transcriptional regulator
MSPSEVLLETRIAESTVTVVRYAPFQRIHPHAHGEEGLTVVLQGTFLEEAHRGTMLAQAGSVATRPYGLPHTNRFGPEGAVILAVIPDRDRFEERISDWAWSDIPAAFRAGLRLVGRDEDALPELLAAVGSQKRLDRITAARVRRRLDDPEQRASVTDLARSMDIHPVHLARQFRQAYGVSVREYRTIQLVKRATTAILATKTPLSRIAHDCGFADHSHMCRAFRHVAGWSPSRLRPGIAGAVGSLHAMPTKTPFRPAPGRPPLLGPPDLRADFRPTPAASKDSCIQERTSIDATASKSKRTHT